MIEKYGAFALLDSSYKTPQHIQMMTFRNYTAMHAINLEFYGGELVGTEYKHRLFEDYIENKRYSDYIFFSIRQFIDESMDLQETIIKAALEKNITLHFANENRKISKHEDILIIKGLLVGIKSKSSGDALRNAIIQKYSRKFTG